MTVKKCKVTSGPATHKYYYEVYEDDKVIATFYDPIRLQHGECVTTHFIVETREGTYIEDALYYAAAKVCPERPEYEYTEELCKKLYEAGFKL